METYNQFKKRHSEEMNNFEEIFFAFSNQQFKEGMEKLGLNEKDTQKVYSIGNGGIILKEKAKEFHAMINRFSNELKENLKNDDFLLDALSYELANHEYCITYDLTDTLDCLELELKDIKPEILKLAKQSALQEC